jgi:hypothetical protein
MRMFLWIESADRALTVGFWENAMVSTQSTPSFIVRLCILGLLLCCLAGLIVLATTEATIRDALPSWQTEKTVAAGDDVGTASTRKVRTVPIDSNGQPIAEPLGP